LFYTTKTQVVFKRTFSFIYKNYDVGHFQVLAVPNIIRTKWNETFLGSKTVGVYKSPATNC